MTMTLSLLPAVLNQVLITPGALAVLDQFAGDKQTCLAVTRAIEGAGLDSHDEPRTRVISGARLAVRFLPRERVALIITAGQAWKSPSASLDQALIDVSTRFNVA